MSDELEARVAALEAECAWLRDHLLSALGESMFIGPFAAGTIITAARAGALNADAVREGLEGLTLLLERRMAALPDLAQAIQFARARAEASLRSLPQAAPEPR